MKAASLPRAPIALAPIINFVLISSHHGKWQSISYAYAAVKSRRRLEDSPIQYYYNALTSVVLSSICRRSLKPPFCPDGDLQIIRVDIAVVERRQYHPL